jgi:hypothetical protein
MEGVKGSLSNSSLFANGEEMNVDKIDILITALIIICVVLGSLVAFLVNELRFYKKTITINYDLKLKDAKIAEIGLGSAKNLVSPEDFKINAAKLRTKLVHGLETKNHSDVGTLAWTILNHAGFENYVESDSRKEIEKALTRLLINGDSDATRRFLESVADSVCASIN